MGGAGLARQGHRDRGDPDGFPRSSRFCDRAQVDEVVVAMKAVAVLTDLAFANIRSARAAKP